MRTKRLGFLAEEARNVNPKPKTPNPAAAESSGEALGARDVAFRHPANPGQPSFTPFLEDLGT